MPNTYLDKAIAAVPKFGERISLFTKKLRLAQYADSSIYDYRLGNLLSFPSLMFFKAAHRFLPTNPFAPVTSIFIFSNSLSRSLFAASPLYLVRSLAPVIFYVINFI